MKKLIRTSTIPGSMDILLKGQLSFLQNHYKVTAISGDGINLQNIKNRERVSIYPIEMQRQISPVKDFISLWKLYVFFRKEKPDIVHSMTPKAGLLSMAAAYFARVPVRIHTFTGLIFPTKRGAMQKLLIIMDKMLCRLATNIYPEGKGVKNDLVNYNITKKHLKVIANGNVNGIDIEYFDPQIISFQEKENLKKHLKIDINNFVFIFVGRLVKDKGVDELINAFQKISKEYKNSKLILVGPLEQDLDPLSSETLKEIEFNNNIISVGFQSDVRPYFAISNVLVFPSYREGFPNVVLQAGAMNLPSIVTNINGSNEIIIENENGTIIPVKNSEAIYEAMKKMRNNEQYRNHLSQNARSLIISRYNQYEVWQAILNEYKSLK